MPSPLLRPATEADVAVILTLIRELADYEKLGPHVVATEDDVRQSLFRDRPDAEVILAEVNGDIAGFALFFHNYSTFLCRRGLYLEDLFVRPAYRGQGIGRNLLQHLAQIARDRGCGRMEWWVLDWNERAINFYRSLGAEPMKDWTVFRLNAPELARLAQRTSIEDEVTFRIHPA